MFSENGHCKRNSVVELVSVPSTCCDVYAPVWRARSRDSTVITPCTQTHTHNCASGPVTTPLKFRLNHLSVTSWLPLVFTTAHIHTLVSHRVVSTAYADNKLYFICLSLCFNLSPVLFPYSFSMSLLLLFLIPTSCLSTA